MNEQKIKQLTEQANLSADKIYQFDPKDGFKIQEWDKIRLEKFAELIVRECLDIADEQKKYVEDMEVFNEQDATWNRARIQQSQHIVDKIKQHFGVEELPVNAVDRILRTVRTRSK